MRRRADPVNGFISIFDEKTGFYYRSNVVEQGRDTGREPFMAQFPELLDVGIMGHCIHGMSGKCISSQVQCYQNGLYREPVQRKSIPVCAGWERRSGSA